MGERLLDRCGAPCLCGAPGPSDRVPGPWCLLPPVEALVQGSSYLRAPVPGVLHLFHGLGFSFRVQRCGGGLAAHGSLGWWVQEITVWRSAMGRQYRHLTLAEREDIMVHWKNRVGVSEIARLVGRDKSTVSREIRRNGWYSPVAGRMWCYRASTAHDKSQRRARRCRRQPLLADPRRLELVARLIRDRHWSPEQIEGRIMTRAPRPGRERHNHLQGGPQRPAGPHSRRTQQDERPIAPQEAPQEGPSRRAGQDHDHPRAERAARHRRPARTGG